MATRRLCIASIVCVVMLGLSLAKGDTTNSVQGLITGTDGKPVAHAEVRAERTDAAGKRVVTRTDANGYYKFASLPAGKYNITVVTDGDTSKPANATATVSSDGQPIRRFISAMPYQVKADYRHGGHASARSQYVWKPGETGSHIPGRWVKVSEIKDPGADPVQKLPGTDTSTVPALRVNSLR